MTARRDELMKALLDIQNTPAFSHQDIMTFSAFLNDDELARHVETMRARSEAVGPMLDLSSRAHMLRVKF